MLFVFSTGTIYAQNVANGGNKTIVGEVTDDAGASIPGVTVLSKGTSNATITDLDGKYSITVSNDVTTLVFSFMGMEKQEIEIGSQTEINVVLLTNAQELGDVLVIGYGTQKKSDRTGAVSQVGDDDLNKGVITDPIQSLQGKVSGVLITKKGGDPNAGFSVKIRGATNISGNTAPLYVVDGVPGVDPTSIAPEDIASFNILKDASSTAIYGSRGANGVVIITTKRGAKNSSSFEINSYVSFDQVANRLDLLSADEVRQYAKDNNLNLTDGGANTDWQDAIYRTGMSQNHNIAYSGGSGKTYYRASVSHLDFKGVVLGTDKVRDIARMNLTHSALNDRLVISTNLAGTIEKNNYISYGGNGSNDIFYQTFQRNPTDPIYDTDGEFYEISRDFNYYNPVALINQIQNDRDAKRLLANLKTDFTIVDGLIWSTNLSYIRNDEYHQYFEPSYVRGGTSDGYGSLSYNNHATKLLETTLNFKKQFGGSNFDVIAGYSYQEYIYNGLNVQGRQPVSDIIGINNIAVMNNVNIGDISSYRGSNKLISFFGRAVYNYNSKYYLTATLRRDGSSKFGANHEWGLFPSASAAWNIKNEDFMQNVDFISEFKLRVGYGFSGNEAIGDYNDVVTYSPSGVPAIDPVTGEPSVILVPNHNGNPDLKWEENKEINIGIDYGFAKNRFVGSVEYFNKTTYDMLGRFNVPQPPNISSTTYANVGTIIIKGFEFNLQAFIIDHQNFKWKTLATFSTNSQDVVSLSNDKFSWVEGHEGNLYGRGLVGENWTQIVAPGYRLGTFYMYEYAGISDDGEFLFYTKDGGVTRNAADAERRVVGCALPKFTIGFSNFFTLYKNVDLAIAAHTVYGYDIYNLTRTVYGNATWLPSENVLHSALVDQQAGLNDNPTMSSYYLEDGSFARIDNVTLGYTFDTQNSAWVKKIRVYASGNNLYTFTNYTGIDPEITFDGLSFGIDNYNVYPKTRSISLGVNFIF